MCNRLMQEHRAAVKVKRAASVNIKTTYVSKSFNQIVFLLFSFFRIFNSACILSWFHACSTLSPPVYLCLPSVTI